MRTLKTAFTVTALALVITMLPVSGKAADLNQKTIIAFTQPVAIPGLVLQPGAYVLKTSDIDRNVVQVYDGSETHLLTTLMTVSSQRPDVSSKAVVFDERPAGTPIALRAWFSSGETAGHEFVYSPTVDSGK